MGEKKEKVQIITLGILVLLFILGISLKSLNTMLIATVLLCASNVIFAMFNLKGNIIFFIFNITFFTLVLGKNTIYMITGKNWYAQFTNIAKIETIAVIFMALFSLKAGQLIFEKIIKKQEKHRFKGNSYEFFIKRKTYIEKITLAAFYITLLCIYIVELEKLIFVWKNSSYLALYKNFKSSIPYFISKTADMNFLFLSMYLATFPKPKKLGKVFIPYGVYLVLSLLVGVRGPLVIKSIFIGIYLFIRQSKFQNEVYYTKKRVIILMVVLFVAMAFLSMYNLWRNRLTIKKFSIIHYAEQFFIDQGTSGDTLAYSIQNKNKLRDLKQHYTFGFFINNFRYGTISKIFGISKVHNTDKISVALHDNNLGASISYIVLGNRYLNGEGLGTQYLAELYIDYSFIGIIIYNFLLGGIMILCTKTDTKNWALYTIILFLIPEAIYLPRQFAADVIIHFISLTAYLQFGLVLLLSEIYFKFNKKEKV